MPVVIRALHPISQSPSTIKPLCPGTIPTTTSLCVISSFHSGHSLFYDVTHSWGLSAHQRESLGTQWGPAVQLMKLLSIMNARPIRMNGLQRDIAAPSDSNLNVLLFSGLPELSIGCRHYHSDSGLWRNISIHTETTRAYLAPSKGMKRLNHRV